MVQAFSFFSLFLWRFGLNFHLEQHPRHFVSIFIHVAHIVVDDWNKFAKKSSKFLFLEFEFPPISGPALLIVIDDAVVVGIQVGATEEGIFVVGKLGDLSLEL